ncbi:uncharacterized protein At4g04775-like [Lotus japonicus]|uniref:uncharacterized protein At4g04775-like n=1 Tax=Lotus japonicus TaxID=34305 RepID=UPI00258C2161|nr:uncharacterized protein At4g04775-like [Lotus japonicus]
MRRPCSSGSCASSGTYSIPPGGICACGELIVYLTSHTSDNPGRHFWRCRNFKGLWFLLVGVQSSGTQRVVDMLRTELEDSKNKLEELKKKLEDTKMKLEESKNKISKLDCELLNKKIVFAAILIVVLGWVVSICFLYGRKM